MAVGHMMDHLAQAPAYRSIFGIELGLRQAMHGRAQIRRSASDLAKKHLVFLHLEVHHNETFVRNGWGCSFVISEWEMVDVYI